MNEKESLHQAHFRSKIKRPDSLSEAVQREKTDCLRDLLVVAVELMICSEEK